MLFNLFKFMVECGCNRAHRALKGHIFAEAFTVSHQACAFALCGSRARALSRHYEGSREKKKKENGFQVLLQSEERGVRVGGGSVTGMSVNCEEPLGCGKPAHGSSGSP